MVVKGGGWGGGRNTQVISGRSLDGSEGIHPGSETSRRASTGSFLSAPFSKEEPSDFLPDVLLLDCAGLFLCFLRLVF